MKRQPEGIPTGGQFAPDRKGEPTSSLASGVQERFDRTMALDELEASRSNHPAQTRGVHLRMDESENYRELADGEVVEDINVTRTSHGYVVEATKPMDLHDLAPTDLGYDEKGDWLDHNRTTLDAFFKERYGAEVDYNLEGGWDESTIKTERTIPDSTTTHEGDIASAAWDSMVQFHNESDNGTFGSENMDRLLQEKCTSPTVIPEPSADTQLVVSDADGTRYAKAGDIQKAPREGWTRDYNRFTGEYTVTTPDFDSWTYKVAQ